MIKRFWIPVLALALLAGCSSTYEARPLGFKPPSAYASAIRIGSLEAAAQSYDDAELAEKDFGFDILGSQVLPVKVVFDNRSGSAYQINPGQTFLEDADGELWQLLDKRTTFDRVQGYTQEGELISKGARTGVLGGIAGALIGAAIGIVSGDVGTGVAVGKGAAVGAIAGGILGGAQGLTDEEPMREIRRDLARKALENKPISPQALSVGVLYFPGEAAAPTRLRMQIRNQSTGELHSVLFPLRPGAAGATVQPVIAPVDPAAVNAPSATVIGSESERTPGNKPVNRPSKGTTTEVSRG